jgi:hypothetical protein
MNEKVLFQKAFKSKFFNLFLDLFLFCSWNPHWFLWTSCELVCSISNLGKGSRYPNYCSHRWTGR